MDGVPIKPKPQKTPVLALEHEPQRTLEPPEMKVTFTVDEGSLAIQDSDEVGVLALASPARSEGAGAGAGEIVTYERDVAGERIVPRYHGDKLALRTLPLADDPAEAAKLCVEATIANRVPVPDLNARTPAYSLQRMSEEGKQSATALQLSAARAAAPREEIPMLELEEEEHEPTVSRYANWRPEDSIVSANLPGPKDASGPPPEQPPKKSLQGAAQNNIEWSSVIEVAKRPVDKTLKRRDPDELAAEAALKAAFAFD
jgi:hypothetical protein